MQCGCPGERLAELNRAQGQLPEVAEYRKISQGCKRLSLCVLGLLVIGGARNDPCRTESQGDEPRGLVVQEVDVVATLVLRMESVKTAAASARRTQPFAGNDLQWPQQFKLVEREDRWTIWLGSVTWQPSLQEGETPGNLRDPSATELRSRFRTETGPSRIAACNCLSTTENLPLQFLQHGTTRCRG